MRNLGVALNDDDTAALDTLCDFVEKTINRPLVSCKNRGFMKTKMITLSVEQWEIIKEAVALYWDAGPVDEGWQSDGLAAASAALESAIESAVEHDG